MTIQSYEGDGELSPLWDKVNFGPLEEKDYDALKDAMPTYTYLLILKLLRCSGVRISELLSLVPRQKSNVGLHHCILVKRAKQRGKETDQLDPIFMPGELGIEIDAYIKDHLRKPNEPIFQGSKPGQRLTNRALEYVFHKAGLQIGRPVTPHMIRSFYSDYLADNGVPIDVISLMLGHSSTKTTMEHYRKLTMAKRQDLGERIRP